MAIGPVRPVTYFYGKDENFNLVLPLLFIVATFVGFYFGIQFNSFEENLFLIVSQFVFLNWLHVLFTPYMLREYPELKAWYVNKCKQEPWTLFWWITMWLVFFAMSFWGLWAINTDNFWLKHLAFLVFSVRGMWGMQHAVAQWLGLNIAFNLDLQKQSGSPKLVQAQKIERRLARWFLILLNFNILIFAFPHLLVPYVPYCQFIGINLMLVVLIILFVNSFSFFNGKMNRKFIFQLRMILWPLAFLSPIALCGARSMHGVEYLFTMRKMRDNSSAGQKSWNWKLLIFLLLPLGVMFLADERVLGRWAQEQIPQYKLLVLAIWSAGIASLTLHYYLDSVLFRMRDAKTKEAVGPLLVKTKIFHGVSPECRSSRQSVSNSENSLLQFGP